MKLAMIVSFALAAAAQGGGSSHQHGDIAPARLNAAGTGR
jgi:hypothetical protein